MTGYPPWFILRSYHTLPFLALILWLCTPQAVHSQTDHQLLFEVQDSVFIDLINDEVGDTTSPDLVWAFYEFHTLYDSCRAFYTFTELQNAGTRIELDNWEYLDFKTNMAPATLNDLSRSRPFVVHTGDTLSFYREFVWFNPHTQEQKTNNYFSEDDLEYVIRLKKTGTNTVLATLDSLGVYSKVPSGAPWIYGNGPAYYVVHYVVPAAHNNKEVYVDVNVTATGTGDYFPARRDDIGINLSAAVTNPCWSPFFSQYGGTAASKAVEITEGTTEAALLGTSLDQTSRTVRIIVDGKELAGRPLTLSIYRMDGTRVFTSSWTGGEELELQHVFTASGSYVLALITGNELLDSQKFYVP